MAIGIVNDTEFDKEVEKLDGQKVGVTFDNARVVTPLPLGRGEGSKEVPEVLRKIIGESAIEDGNKETIENIAGPLGISPSSVSAYKNGATSTASYNTPSEALAKHLNMTRSRISRKASKKLNEALGLITTEKLEAAKLRDISAVAKDMSAIMKDMEPRVEKNDDGKPNVSFVFMAPRVKNEQQYETITVSE